MLAPLTGAAAAPGLDPGKAVTQYSVDLWTTANGLPQNTLTSIVQTADGYLWIASFGGLTRFDGARFETFDRANTPQLRNSGIHTLWPDADGTLWVGTNGGGLTRLAHGRFQTWTSDEGLAGDVVRAIYRDRRGRLWVGTNSGLTLFEEGAMRSYATAQGLANPVVRAIREDRDGTLWVGTNGGGLCRLRGERFECLGAEAGLTNAYVFAVLIDREGTLWVGTNGGGLFRREGERFRRFGAAQGLASDVVWALYEDSLGSLWVGTYGGGLYRREGERFAAIRAASGLSSDFVRALWQDHEGSLWVGTYTGGLNRLRDGKFTVWTTREGLPADIVKPVLAARDGGVHLGTSGGGLARLRDGRVSVPSGWRGLPNDFVQALHEDSDGTLWAGTNGGGLVRLGRGERRVFTTRDGLPDDHISTVTRDHDGVLWIGTNASGVARYDGKRFTTLGRDEGLASNLVMCTLVDRENGVWIGTDGGGLTRIHGGVTRTFTSADGLPSDNVLSLFEDAQGSLWAGTSGGGLALHANGRFVSFSTRDGLREDVVFAILQDGVGDLWLSGNAGISRVSRASLLARERDRAAPLRVISYGIADGLKSNECSGISQPAGARTSDGRLWFPTTKGVVAIDPAAIPMNAVPPPVRIEDLQAGGRRYGAEAAIELPPGASSWEIRYTALSMVAPSKVRFRYRLEGYDEGWVEAGNRREAFYTQVPPGRYAFRVAAANDDGLWNDEGAQLLVELRPRLHQTRLFYALAALGLLGAAGLAYSLRVRRLEARRRELEAQVLARTAELREQTLRTEHAREEAERLRDRAERQREIAQRANGVKTEVLSIAAHDLKNPLQMIQGYAELAEQKAGADASLLEFVRTIQASVRRMLELIDQLLDTAALEAGRIPLRQELVDLQALAREVVEVNRSAALQKGQQLALDDGAAALVRGDEGRLYEVLENLLNNAIKYSPLGAPIRVRVTQSGSRVCCAVEDSGPGLSEQDRERLFGRFQRLTAKPTAGESATGLGLAIVKELVELHGGSVRAESDGPGKGSRFVIELESVDPHAVPGPGESSRPGARPVAGP
ncbi:MAG: two-component regulator propeller domain-containing protein [Vicinamibacteria bacterium]